MVDKQSIIDNLDIKDFYNSEFQSIKWNESNMGLVLCPFHRDTKPSLSINGNTGHFKCFGCNAGGSVFDFYMKKYNVDFKNAFDALAKKVKLNTELQKRIVATYDYTDEKGELLFQVVRYEPKAFSQRRPDGSGGWIWNLNNVRLVPYNLPEVVKSDFLIIVEGEKDADNLNTIGFTATCNAMGAGKWREEYNAYFRNKEVAIIADNDIVGKRHAETVAINLKPIAKSVKIVELPNLKEKEDVSDWIAQGHTKEELTELINKTSEWVEAKKDTSFLKKGSELILLESNIQWVVDRLIPKHSITLLHGKGGIGKTWLSLIIANAVSKGIPFMGLNTQSMPVILVDFENSLSVLTDRVKKTQASEVLFWHNTNEIKPPKLDSKEWNQYKGLPKGLLIFDTLRASQSRDENDSKEMAFVMSRLKELRDMGFTILLLHHTPKSNEKTYKGSTVIVDLADHVLSLHKVKRNSLDEINDDDELDYLYYFGTKDKTRYEYFHIFLEFDPEKGFVLAPDPDEETMKEMYNLIVELRDSSGELPVQKQVIERAKERLKLSYAKTRKLLKRGEGRFWNSKQAHEKKNAILYEPVFQFFNTIYSCKTEKLKLAPQESLKNTPHTDTPQVFDNTEFFSFSKGVCKTEKLEVIELENEQVELIE